MSIHTAHIKDTFYLPLDSIRRPIPPVLDHTKIDAMVCTLQTAPTPTLTPSSYTLTPAGAQQLAAGLPIAASDVITTPSSSGPGATAAAAADEEASDRPQQLPPIDILALRAQDSPTGAPVYFGFGGCHRFQAYTRAGAALVRVKVVWCNRRMLSLYLGSSVDKVLDGPGKSSTPPQKA